MIISKDIGCSPVDALQKLLEFVRNFDAGRLIYAITRKRVKEDEIKALTFAIREQNLKLEKQKVSLFAFTGSFNDIYTHEDNKIVDTSARLLFGMRSGVKGVKKSVNTFYIKSRRQLPPGSPAPQAIDKSLINASEYQQDLYGLFSFPDCVQELFSEMEKFVKLLYECLIEALRTLSEERLTRQDARRCRELLLEAINVARYKNKTMLDVIKANPQIRKVMEEAKELNPDETNPILQEWMRCRGSEEEKNEFAKKYFHNCRPEDMVKIDLMMALHETDGNLEVLDCMTVFGCDVKRAKTINWLIDNFDQLLPPKCKRGAIPSRYLYVFMKKYTEGVSYDAFLNYFNPRYKNAGGRWNTISKSALSAAAVECTKGKREYTEAFDDFNARLVKLTGR